MKRFAARAHSPGDDGWTLLELMVVMLIIVVLLGIAIATYSAATAAANAAACRENQMILNRAISVTRASGTEVDDISDLASCVLSFDKVSKCPSDGTLLQYDAATDSVTCPNHP